MLFINTFNYDEIVTSGYPFVNVPVLSNAIASKRPVSSKMNAAFNQNTLRAAFPIAVTIATGVETTSAHGQPTTRTASP